MRRAKAWWSLTTLTTLVILVVLGSPALAADAEISAKVDGRSAAGSNNSRPVRLSTRPAVVDLEVTNRGTAPIVARTVRFSGSVMGLTFFAYETSVDIRVDAGATESRQFTLDLAALKGQASGLLPSSITLLDANRKPLGSQRLVADVRGSVWSVYGFFGLVIAVLTAIALASSLVALAGHRLSPNRWSRGLRFLVPGIGFGVMFVIGFSVLRIFAPTPSRWVPIMAVCALGMFAVGYLSPSPDDGETLDADPPRGSRTTQAAGDARPTLPSRRRP